MSGTLRFPQARITRPPTRWACTDSPVTCRRCHISWASGDPALSLHCRGCQARAGSPCRRAPGGNERVCFERDCDAERVGLQGRCSGLSGDHRHDKKLILRAAPMTGHQPVTTGAPASR